MGGGGRGEEMLRLVAGGSGAGTGAIGRLAGRQGQGCAGGLLASAILVPSVTVVRPCSTQPHEAAMEGSIKQPSESNTPSPLGGLFLQKQRAEDKDREQK